MSRKKPRNRLRRILEVAVHEDRDVAVDMVEHRRQRRLVTEIPGQRDRHDARICRGGRLDDRPGPVHAAIVHQHHLVPRSGQHVEHAPEALEELGQHGLLVVEGDAD